MTARILVADDDAHLRRGICDLLSLEGYECVGAADGLQAWELYQSQRFDFLVLDVMMPEIDGLDLCRQIRVRDARIPILLLTARGQEIDRVVGFRNGADDYVPKPFGSMELVARIQAILRRATQPTDSQRFQMGDLTIDSTGLRAARGTDSVDLTPREVQVLSLLHTKAGQAVTRDQLFDHCWGRDYMPNSRSLDQYVSALRRKIEIDPANPQIIRTVYGVGYRFDPP